MRRSRTTRHETLGNTLLFSFSVAVPDEIYTLFIVGGLPSQRQKNIQALTS
jgi:hypothetical protein